MVNSAVVVLEIHQHERV